MNICVGKKNKQPFEWQSVLKIFFVLMRKASILELAVSA